jgi:circadian clock protein KaiB
MARAGRPKDARGAFEAAIASSEPRFVLRLFIAGSTPRSTEALANLMAVCEEHLAGRYDLEVVDVYQQPKRARIEQIVAVPTLLKLSPDPIRRLIGDLSEQAAVLEGLGLRRRRRKP